MTPPAVSVVVPCFNGGRFLDGLLASLKAQTFRDFEVVIVDDGSNEPATCRKLAELGEAGRVLRQDNRGLPAARNAGFAAARGEFILPLDCDDTLAPSYLEETVSRLRADSSKSFAFTDMRLVGGLSGTLGRNLNAFDQLFINRLPYCMLIRKAAWRAVGGYDAAMRDGYEDWDFNVRLLRAGFQGIRIAKPLFIYRVSAEGMLFSHSARMHGQLWGRIRKGNESAYAFSSLRRLRNSANDPPPRIGLATALFLLYAHRCLPERATNWAFNRCLRLLHGLRSRLQGSSRSESAS